jgi:hypothetical protein
MCDFASLALTTGAVTIGSLPYLVVNEAEGGKAGARSSNYSASSCFAPVTLLLVYVIGSELVPTLNLPVAIARAASSLLMMLVVRFVLLV